LFPLEEIAMTTTDQFVAAYEFNRSRTLGLLDAIEQLKSPATALAYRPGPGRAPIAWQLMHIGITEELFATERLLPAKKPAFADLIPRFKGGSTPDDNTPSASLIRQVLSESRLHLLDTLGQFGEQDLPIVPDALKDRNWTLLTVLHVLAWHEPHHQGQSHISLNLFKAAQGAAK
jgi:uncharacterized damage-inducible protein DinB